MNTETQIKIFSLSAILLFGAVLGGFTTFQMMDQRIDDIESQLDQSQKDVESINQSGFNSLTSLFHNNEDSVVYIEVIGGQRSQGSGFVYSEEGHIVTNQHVVSEAERVRVTFTDGTTKTAEIVGTDVYTDLAVLKVEKEDLNPVEIGDSENAKIGETVVAIGNPFGLRGSITSGIISQKERLLPTRGGFSIPNVLQTDASINPGNSGGPLLNTRGQVIGVNTAIESNTGTFSGVGFAIPSQTVERVVPSLIEDGDYQHSWIGVSGVDMNSDLAEEMNTDQESGFLVMEVVDGSPADEAGVQVGDNQVEIAGQRFLVGGDIIVAIDDREVRDISDILVYLAQETEVGDTVTLTVLRNGEEVELDIVLESRPN